MVKLDRKLSTMPLVLDLPPEMETQLRDEALRLGVGAEEWARETLLRRLRRNPARRLAPTPHERQLLSDLNAELPAAFWRRYNELREKGAGGWTESEQQEYIHLNDRMEAWNVRRLQTVKEIAQRRGIAPFDLLRSWKIERHPDADTRP